MVSSMSWVWCLASRVLRSPSVSPPASPERAIFPSPSFTSPDCSRCWVFSAAYNLWPVSRIKWLLRRFDHSAIYLLIAATYTPFTVQMRSGLASGLLVGIWTAAAVGIVLKLVLPGRFDRLSLVLYLLLGWRCDAVRCDHLAAVLDHMAAGRGRRALLAGRRLPPMGEPALPERDLALFRSTRRCLPLPCGVRIPWRDDLNAGRGAISSRLSVQPEPGLAGPSHCRVAGSRS